MDIDLRKASIAYLHSRIHNYELVKTEELASICAEILRRHLIQLEIEENKPAQYDD